VQIVYDGSRCVGFLIQRGKLGVEAFDGDERSLGIFETAERAAAAVRAAAEGVSQ